MGRKGNNFMGRKDNNVMERKGNNLMGRKRNNLMGRKENNTSGRKGNNFMGGKGDAVGESLPQILVHCEQGGKGTVADQPWYVVSTQGPVWFITKCIYQRLILQFAHF